MAAILWKIKQKYDMYRRRQVLSPTPCVLLSSYCQHNFYLQVLSQFQRLFVEMEQMASRPFSQVLVEIERREKVLEANAVDTDTQHSTIASLRKRKKMSRQVCVHYISVSNIKLKLDSQLKLQIVFINFLKFNS